MGIQVTSEIKTLKKVLLHRPGKEVENLTPEYLERLLFDDIPYLKIAQREHDAFAQILRENEVEVVYLHELVANVLEDEGVKVEFIKQFINEAGINGDYMKECIYEYLKNIKSNEELVLKTMSGINKSELPPLKNKNLSDYLLDEYPFVVDPMPNLYFTRDPFANIGNTVSINKMYSVTRSRETLYGDYVFNFHPEYKDTYRVYNRDLQHSIEGGDILNLNEKTLAIGISQRTTPQAIEVICKNLFYNTKGNKIDTVLAFNIPKSRAYMHLDTVFTQVDYDKFTIHPGIQGPLEVFEITKSANKELNIKRVDTTLEAILSKHLDVSVKLIQCGGGDYVISHREQWNDGSNTLCIKPGEVIVYDRNYVTNQILEDCGVKTYIMPSSELSRGRGGPRCMSMPLVRDI